MGLFQKLGFTGAVTPAIDWDLHPAETFAIFESWGGKTRVTSSKERFYYFFINLWEKPASLCLMERGIKFARVLAKIDAPQKLIDDATAGQGKTMGMDRHYGINAPLKDWLKKHVVNNDDASKVIPLEIDQDKESMISGLPGRHTPLPAAFTKVSLDTRPTAVLEDEVKGIVKTKNYFDSQHNPDGNFTNFLVDNNDEQTITDKVTGLMWQRGGADITSLRKMLAYVRKCNEEKFAGYTDWRLPTMEEALSLLEQKQNDKGLFLHPCFSREQPFIFLAEKREPGGYWFCDFKQGTLFWASGTIPGGFGRLCRNAE
ncbi:MAG: DUF1566 domain-containing protein [Desulfobulbaceae bacterium]|nr:DUF1566 domain-containing protein [Desulfobulbaceae bacterium]